jgi:sulfatase maturation enzyme AslB (radical SAM superfamily)
MQQSSPFTITGLPRLDTGKFSDPRVTATGGTRASVVLTGLNTLWLNTGTLCNLACKTCYIESSPTNDALVYLTLAEVETYLDEIAASKMPTREIGFTGGEPFMNRDCTAMMALALTRGFDVLMLTNAMRPMRRFEADLLALPHRDRLTMRVSLDHYTKDIHEAERGENSWDKAIEGLIWLAANGFRIAVAGRHLPRESDSDARAGYVALFAQHGLTIEALILFPEMDAHADVPEITTACWGILDVAPETMMCASSRMIVKRKGEGTPRVVACTLLPYEAQFDMGATLSEATTLVHLNHPHCARFCVLGGASCSG